MSVTPSSLRVLHCTPTWFASESVLGGGERWVDNVVHALSIGAPRLSQAILAIGQEEGLRARYPCILRVLRAESGQPRSMEALSPLIWDEIEPFDLIHVHQVLTDFGAYVCCAAASLGKTIVATDLGGGANPVMIAGGLGLVDGILSISNYAHSLIAASLRSPSIAFIGPIDTDFWTPAVDLPPQPAVICVSRILPHKGIDRILRTLPPGLKLRIVGRVYHDAYRSLLADLARGKDVEFIHDADDEAVRALYRRSSIFAQGSCFHDIYGNTTEKTELMGLTTLEAMSCGLPVTVSADGGSLPELVTDPAFGRVFHNETELASLFLRHRDGGWPEPPARQAARAHVIEVAGLEAYGRRLADFYARVHAARTERLLCVS
jgi:glycosyltransferase involved in cell wall biosynthesis